MEKLTRADLYPLEEYARIRPDFRAKVMAHKRDRQVAVGPHATLYFEDRLTMQYQVQEMLRAERIFEAEGIVEELATYNPLIPDGSNLKATLMIEYMDPRERQEALMRLKGIEDRVWVQVTGFGRVWAIADEDLEREDETKTSSVHFVRFELTPKMIQAVSSGVDMAVGIEHGAYTHKVEPLSRCVRDALAKDLSA